MSSDTPAPRQSRGLRPLRFVVEPLESRRLLTAWLDGPGGPVQTVDDQVGSVTFTVHALPGDTPSPVPVQVSFDTLDTAGTAVPGIDYTPVHETFTFPTGTSQVSVTIPILPDAENTQGRSIVLSVDHSPYPADMPSPKGPPTSVGAPATPLVATPPDIGETRQNAIVYVVHQPDHGAVAMPLVATTGVTSLGVPAQNASVSPVSQPDHAPPVVVGSRLLTRRGRITAFVLQFSADMNKASVENLNNYEILRLRPPLARVPLSAATYDAATRSVTLTPAHPVPKGGYLLEHQSPPNPLETPITDATGLALDGNGDGLPDGTLAFKFPFPGHPRGLNLGIIPALPASRPRGRGPRY